MTRLIGPSSTLVQIKQVLPSLYVFILYGEVVPHLQTSRGNEASLDV
jgi:hypothetical protein